MSRTGQIHPQADPQTIRAMFDRIARTYSLVNTLVSFGQDSRWRRAAARLAEVHPTDEMLDVCCGPGEFADAFAAGEPSPARIVACDFSSRMLAMAERRQHRRARPLELLCADATELPFADGSFDMVSCAFGLRNLAEPRAGLAEFYRVLRPGGRLVILEFSMPAGLPGAIYRIYFRHALPAIAGLISKDRHAYRYLPRSVESFFAPGELGVIVESVSFVKVRQRRLACGIATVTLARRPKANR